MTKPEDFLPEGSLVTARLDTTETALAGLVHENNELRAIIRRVREYAQLNQSIAEELRAIDRPYSALPYENAALTLERIIGGPDVSPPRDLADAQRQIDELANDLECLRLDYDHLSRNYRQLRRDINGMIASHKVAAEYSDNEALRRTYRRIAGELTHALDRPLEGDKP